MGARLVTQALSPEWACLSDTARLVLIAMCHTAKDHPSEHQAAGQYFAGRDYLILALSGCDPDDDDWRSTSSYRTWTQRIKRATRELVSAEAVVLLRPAHRGRHAIYEVTPGQQATLLQTGS